MTPNLPRDLERIDLRRRMVIMQSVRRVRSASHLFRKRRAPTQGAVHHRVAWRCSRWLSTYHPSCVQSRKHRRELSRLASETAESGRGCHATTVTAPTRIVCDNRHEAFATGLRESSTASDDSSE
jgi:hypothetical protein